MRNQFFQDFADKDWSSFFGNFEDPIKKLVKEFYFNAWFIGAELKCWVWEKDFVITLDYLAKILRINLSENVDTSPYDDRLALVAKIFDSFGVDHEVSTIRTSIGTSNFGLEMKSLTLIMFSSLYLLSNTGFINLRRVLSIWFNQGSSNWYLCSHILDHGQNSGEISYKDVFSFLQSCHEDHDS